jgi:hypothetical protein
VTDQREVGKTIEKYLVCGSGNQNSGHVELGVGDFYALFSAKGSLAISTMSYILPEG